MEDLLFILLAISIAINLIEHLIDLLKKRDSRDQHALLNLK